MKLPSNILLISILAVIYSCSHSEKGQSNFSKPKIISDSNPDDFKSKYKSKIPKTQNAIKNIDSFLMKPFDLYKFKKIKQGSNSGGGNKKGYYYKPKYKGLYFYFFLFHPLIGYIGDSIIRTENGLNIATFKPLGKYQKDYLDPNEELIEVNARYNDFDLPELAFIGLNVIKLRHLLGKESFIKNNSLIYVSADKALILNLQSGKVNWLRYVHLKTPLTINNVPADLLYGE